MLEFENVKELKTAIDDIRKKKVESLSVFQYYSRMAVFLLLFAGIICGTTLLMYSLLTKSAKIVRVPSVVNTKFVDGYMSLKKINLDVHVVLQNFDTIPYGVITAQTIPPEALVKERRKIVLTVSRGQETGTRTIDTNKNDDLRSYYLVFQLPVNVRQTMDIPDNGKPLAVKIFVTDEGAYMNSLVYQGNVNPGDTVRVPLKITGKLKEKVMVEGNTLVEKEIE